MREPATGVEDGEAEGPDLAAGAAPGDVPDGGMLAGRVGDRPVLLARRGDALFAVGARCTHLGGPLAEGLLVGDTVRCPWHHACFSLRTGEALRAPAFDPIGRWRVDIRDGRAFVREPLAPARPARLARTGGGPIVIVGAGAAGFAAADALRRRGAAGEVTVLTADADDPYDRTLLTKDYLDGRFGDDRLPPSRRGLARDGVRVEAGAVVARLDPAARRVGLADGRELPFARLLLATGAEPERPDFPGADLPHVRTLRSLSDCRGILERVAGPGGRPARIVVLGAGFLGLEAAASLRDRGLEVTVVSPDEAPLARILGEALAGLVRHVHEERGVAWRLGRRIAAADSASVTLDDGSRLDADLVLVAVGVVPRTGLAEAAGLAVDGRDGGGVLVDRRLETSAPGVYAAGDIARWPDRHGGRRLRVEHWAVAARQGQTAAPGLLGEPASFDAVPFFWTKHFDLGIRCLGQAGPGDAVEVEGDVEARDAAVRWRRGGRVVASAWVGRDLACLEEERRMEDDARSAVP